LSGTPALDRNTKDSRHINRLLIYQNKIQTIMKKILFLFLITCCGSAAFSQFEYAKEVLSATDMNIKGKIKKLTEIHVHTNKNGKTDDDEPRLKLVYEFDEKGNIIKVEGFEMEENEALASITFEYVNGKLNKVSPGKTGDDHKARFFTYSASAITVKNASGAIMETHTLNNGRVSEVKTFPKDKTDNGYLDSYEYNAGGQIEKHTHKYGKGYSSSFFTKYVYNTQGDFTKQEIYNDGKLGSTYTYEYKYDKTKNWTKCTAVSSTQGDDEKEYESFTRTYEYY